MCDEIMSAADSVSTNLTNIISTNVTNTISTNVPSTVLINPDDKKVRCKTDCYILYTVLLYYWSYSSLQLLLLAFIM